MSKVSVKRKLQKSKFGKFILRLYHYFYSIPISYIRIIKFRMMKKEKLNIQFWKDSEVFEMLLNEKKSLSRFGDGEIAWIYQEANGYFGQENSIELSSALKKVITSQNDSLLIGVPNFFGEMDSYEESRKHNREVHLSKYYKRWTKLLSPEVKYADALITRVYNGRKGIDFNTIFSKWKKIWEGKNVCIVEGSETRFGVGNDLLSGAKSVFRIICPAENAFKKYDSILKKSLLVENVDLFLVALGPTASVLTYDLSLEGHQAIDIGHLDIEYEWFLKKATSKIPIKGKYVNEAGGASNYELEQDVINKYKKQILAIIK